MIIHYPVDDFGNLWIYKVTEDYTLYYPAPPISHEDELHNEWGGLK